MTSHPRQFWRWSVGMEEIYLWSNQPIVTNACKSYVDGLRKIIHESSLYTFTSMISKYLIDSVFISESIFIKGIIFDRVIEKIRNDKTISDENKHTLSNQDFVRCVKNEYMNAYSFSLFNKAFYSDHEPIAQFDIPNAYKDTFIYMINDYSSMFACATRSYSISSDYSADTYDDNRVIEILVNDVLVASISDHISNLSLTLHNYPIIKCTDHINNMYITTRVNNHNYVYITDSSTHNINQLISISLTVTTFYNDEPTNTQDLYLTFDQ